MSIYHTNPTGSWKKSLSCFGGLAQRLLIWHGNHLRLSCSQRYHRYWPMPMLEMFKANQNRIAKFSAMWYRYVQVSSFDWVVWPWKSSTAVFVAAEITLTSACASQVQSFPAATCLMRKIPPFGLILLMKNKGVLLEWSRGQKIRHSDSGILNLSQSQTWFIGMPPLISQSFRGRLVCNVQSL